MGGDIYLLHRQIRTGSEQGIPDMLAVDRDGHVCVVELKNAEANEDIVPVEICETRYPLLVDQFTFNVQPAGAGSHRGGLGLVRDYRILSETAQLTTTFGRHRFLPWGAEGGQPGSANGVAVIRDGKGEPVIWKGKLARYPLKRGDVARMVTGVGGGYGDPLGCDPEAVRWDVRNGFLAVEQARTVYGVAIDPQTLEIDEVSTRYLRGPGGAND